MNYVFKCDKCGACCRHIKYLGKQYQWLINNDGMCKYFNQNNNTCSIYPIRPLVCRVEEAYYIYYSYIDFKTYIDISKKICKQIKKLK